MPAVPEGTGPHERGGEIFAPSQVYIAGICPPAGKASDVTSRGGITPPWVWTRHPEQTKMRKGIRCRATRPVAPLIQVICRQFSMCAPMDPTRDKGIGKRG
jgi:hypothetical protein